MRSVDVVNKLLGEDSGGVGCAGRNEVGELGEPADDYKDRGVWRVLGRSGSSGGGKFCDMIP